MASTMISNAVANSDRVRESMRKKKKKKSQISRDQAQNPNNNQASIEWKSETQQQVYSSKLVQALRQVRLSSPPPAPRPGRAVREAADRVLAVTAKGRTRWSRAILKSRLKLKFMKNRRQRVVATATTRSKRPRVSILRLKSKNIPTVRRKTRLLGRLVPGCRKEPLPVILEEATDYIAALEMQVRAMSALADLLSGASSSNSNSNSNPSVSQLDSNQPPAS
ncbi:transcription factor bHLH148-like [Cornus florida]|uniref:transcription factor bHLH148-like n=1 Tax=Cornus florida TaxID=4283 RepID=UPI00289BB587|nr:transcription factor bHLH148-like [Cornus florida]